MPTKLLYIDADYQSLDTRESAEKRRKWLEDTGYNASSCPSLKDMPISQAQSFAIIVINLGQNGKENCLRDEVKKADFSKLKGRVILTSSDKKDKKLARKKQSQKDAVEFKLLHQLAQEAKTPDPDAEPKDRPRYGNVRSRILNQLH